MRSLGKIFKKLSNSTATFIIAKKNFFNEKKLSTILKDIIKWKPFMYKWNKRIIQNREMKF